MREGRRRRSNVGRGRGRGRSKGFFMDGRREARQTFAWKLVRRNVWGVHRPWRVAQDNQIIGTAANGPHEQSQEDGKLVEAAIAVRVATDDVKDGNGFWRRKCSEGRQLEAARSRETFGAARR
jgi:hypothetical protein